MLVCYLDDSGKDPQNQITTIAGYVGRNSEWEVFEREAEPWFEEFGVDVLHAKDLEGGRGCFKDWKVLTKQAFVARVCQARNAHAMMGVSMGALKSEFQAFRATRGRHRTSSPYAFCFNVIVDWILRDIRTGLAAHSEGIAFIVESGHENNPDAERAFNEVREKFKLERVLRSISFVPKSNSRAIQLADLFAFYARRDNERLWLAKVEEKEIYEAETMLRIIIEGTPHRGFVATTFGDAGSGSRFWGDDL